MRREGLEPSSPEGQRGLSPPCMPIPAPPQWCERHATNCPEPLFALCPTGPPCLPAGPVLHFAAMTRAMLEKRLIEIGAQLRDLRNELAVVDEQFAHFADEADDAVEFNASR